MYLTKLLCPPSPGIVPRASFTPCNPALFRHRSLHTTLLRSFDSSLARLGARQLFPRHTFIPPQFPEEPIGYTSQDGSGFYQGGPGSTVGPKRRYELQAKLGCGVSSTVWLAKDREASDDEKRHVTIRILSGYATKLSGDEKVLRELDVVKALSQRSCGLGFGGRGHVVRVLDHFFQPGVEKSDGEHLCFVTEFYPNELNDVWNAFGGKPLPVSVVKRVLIHLAKGLAELHERGVAHTDLRTGSVLIKPTSGEWMSNAGAIVDAWYDKHPPRKCRPVRTPKGMKSSWLTQPHLPLLESLDTCDFILAGHSHAEFVNDKKRDHHSILSLRAPELIVGYPEWDEKVDIWSYGLMAFRLLTKGTLIQPTRLPGFPPRASIIESMLYQMMCITGEERFPESLLNCGSRSGQYFELRDPDRRGKLQNFDEYQYQGPISKILREEAAGAGVGFSNDDVEGASDFLEMCLEIDPVQRASTKELVGHTWLVE